jgi:hypothetical protein
MLTSKDYLKILEKWVTPSKKYLYTPPDRKDLLCYGTGYDSWGVQTQQKTFSTFAVLATDPNISEKNTGVTRDELLNYALKLLRFNLESHKTGSYHCLNGTKWGTTWISALGIERMMHGINAIWENLKAEDISNIQRVMIAESDNLLETEITAGKTINNRPESNIWNGSILYRTSLMFPNDKRCNQYIEKGTRFLVNGISIESDATSKEKVGDKNISDLYVGDNFFDTFALNHHGYLNIGYMYICLSNIAIIYFEYRLRNLPVPDVLMRHILELWELVKLCTFPDGRICRIGGDTRIRYSYCQDYALPVWLMMYDFYGDTDCLNFEKKWLDTVKKEVDYNKDGSFLSARCSDLEKLTPLYFTRLETDRAATLAMATYWRRQLKIPFYDKPSKLADSYTTKTWYNNYHGACLSRGKNRISSWCWVSAEPPQGLCLPTQRSDMAEWRYNCVGQLIGQGRINRQTRVFNKDYIFEGGFTTIGKTEVSSLGFFEGQSDEVMGYNHIVFTALPDDTTTIVIQKCVSSPRRIYLNELKGFFYNMPNDIFNGSTRSYKFRQGEIKKQGGDKGKEEIVSLNSSWLNVDDSLGFVGVYGADTYSICRPPKRQAGLLLSQYEKKSISTGLWIDEICFPYKKGPFSVDANSILFDICCIILAGVDSKTTSDYSKTRKASRVNLKEEEVRAIIVESSNKKEYIQIVNFGAESILLEIPLKDCKKCLNVFDKNEIKVKENILTTNIGANEVQLFEIGVSSVNTAQNV